MAIKEEIRVRNMRIFEAVVNGKSYGEAGADEGISLQRARQVTQHIRRRLCHPSLLVGTNRPINRDDSVFVIREQSAFWMGQLAKWKLQLSEVTGEE